MLFSDKYPNANDKEQYEHGNYIWSKRSDNCHVCGKITHFIDLNSGGYFCSEECDEKFYNEMFQHAVKML